MAQKRLADSVAWLHWGTVMVLLWGFVLQFIFIWWIPLYLLFWLTSLGISLFMGECPLTRWERNLRAKYDQAHYYDGSFLAHYLDHYFSIQLPQVVISFPFAISFVISVWTWSHWISLIR